MKTSQPIVGRRYGCPSLKFELLAFVLLLNSLPAFYASALAHSVVAWGQTDYGLSNVPGNLTNAVAAAAGDLHSLALRADGTVVAWGYNGEGQTNVPAGLVNVIAVSAFQQSMALKSDGTVSVWGHNDPAVTTVPAAATNVIRIAAGYGYNLALKADGTIVAWGYSSSYGAPNVPAGLAQVKAIAAGGYHALALKNDGTAVAWGYNFYGQTNVPPGLNDIAAIAAGDSLSVALRSNGTVVAWGRNDYGQTNVPAGFNNVVAVATTGSYILALKNDGTVAGWGYNGNGQLNVPAGLTGVVAISAGGQHNLALVTTDQTISITSQPQSAITNLGATVGFSVAATCSIPLNYQWRRNGTNLSSATSSTLTLLNTQLSDSGNYSVVVSHSNASVTSATATLTVAPPPTITAQPENISAYTGANAFFSVTATSVTAVTYQWLKDGSSFGAPNSSTVVLGNVQPADAGNYAVIVSNSSGSVTSAPASLTVLGARPAGTVVSLGGPPVPTGLDDAIAIAAGYGQQLAVRSDGTVVCWGNNNYPNAPQPPPGLGGVVAVASGGIHSIALKSDGTVVGWGHDANPPAGLSGVVAIASGHDHSVALKADGTTVTWGGIPIAPPLGSNLVAVTAAENFSLGLQNDGTIPPPTGCCTLFGFKGASNVVGIAASGLNAFVMLRSDGTVQGWNAAVPAGLSNVVAVSSGLALKSHGTVVSLDATAPAGLTNVTAISGRVGNGLVITTWPVITQPPQSVAVNANTTAAFSVIAAGAPPLNYQWRKNGVNLEGATGTSLTISNAQPADAGTYDVVVGNNAGALASASATLTVNGFPAVTSPPKSETVLVGMRVNFTVTATGAQPLSYQWKKGGIDLAGAGGTSLALSNVQLSDAGNYSVVVSNSYGAVTSAPAVLTVISNAFTLPPPGTVVGLGGTVVPSGLTDVVAIAANPGCQFVAVRSNGTVACWGRNLFNSPQPPPDLSNVVAVAAGSLHSIALKSDGTVVGWGYAANPPGDLFGVVAIASGHDHSIALKADGTTVSWGGIPIAPPPGSNFVAVTAGGNFSLGLRNDGTVPAPTGFSPLPGFNGASNVLGIAASGFSAFAMLRSDGTVQGWYVEVPAGLSNVAAVSGGLALKNDGTVVGLGATAPAGLTNVTAIAGSVAGGLALTTNPPPPVLAGASDGQNFLLSTPLSVPGYVLEAAEELSLPYTVVDGYTNSTTNNIALPLDATRKYFRLRKP